MSFLDPSLQQLAMADVPPSDIKPLADPIRSRPLAPNPNLPRIQEIRGRLRELDKIDTSLGTGPQGIDRRTLKGAMPAEDMARIRAMMDQGMTRQQIAEAFGIGKASVTRKIKSMRESGEIADKGRFWFRGDEGMKQFNGLVKQGYSQNEIARQMGLSPATVNDLFKEQGISRNMLPGGKTVPSMPQFNFKAPNFDARPNEINDYLKALEKHLNDIKAYYNAGPARSFA
jgi:transposase